MADQLPEYNDYLRTGVLTLVSKINIEGVPVGGFLAYVIGLLWGETDKSQAQWDAIKQYAEKLVNHAIDKERVELLNKRLAGLGSIAKAYSSTTYGSAQKGQHLTNLMDSLRLFEPDFWDDRNPEKMFPLFTTFGTLWLAALAEQAFKFKANYLGDDPDAANHLKSFRDEVKAYSDAAQHMFDNLERWRFRQLELVESQSHSISQSESTWVFTDKYDNGTDPVFTVKHTSGDWGHDNHNSGGLRALEIVAQDRIATIRGGFMQDLQNILAAAGLWKYLDPAEKRPVLFDLISDQGPWGSWQHRGPAFHDQPAGSEPRITHIKISAGGGSGGVVECLEIFYDGKSAGTHGNPTGGAISELALQPDEYVVEVVGRVGQFVDRLEFITNKGRRVAGGNLTGGSPFSSRGHRSWQDVSLFAVGGWNDDRRLTGLSLQWKHKAWIKPYTASYKRLATSLSPFVNVAFRGETGVSITNLVNEYSGRAANNEFFARSGASAVSQQIHLPRAASGAAGQMLLNGQEVRIWTTEAAAKDNPYLGKFHASTCYYFASGYDQQLWTMTKVIPTEGPILVGEQVYLRNKSACTYLFATEQGYVGSGAEPYAWEVTPV